MYGGELEHRSAMVLFWWVRRHEFGAVKMSGRRRLVGIGIGHSGEILGKNPVVSVVVKAMMTVIMTRLCMMMMMLMMMAGIEGDDNGDGGKRRSKCW